MRIVHLTLFFSLACLTGPLYSQTLPSTAPVDEKAGAFPGVTVDVPGRQVRVDCETLDISAPLEFFCVVSGTNEHEALLRTPIKASHLHAGLLMLGLQPGSPVGYSEATQKWTPPHGPPLHISLEFDKDGRRQRLPAYRLMRDVKSKREMPPTTWVFTGSRILQDGRYAADITGYIVSVVNFDMTVIDIPQLASSSNETLEWEINKALMPPANTPSTLVFEPAGGAGDLGDGARASATSRATLGSGALAETTPATTVPTAGPTTRPDALSDVTVDAAQIDRLQSAWERAVRPHDAALREAAQAHYEVIGAMRREQQRLIDEADRIQRKIDELEKSYQDMTTPRPPAVEP